MNNSEEIIIGWDNGNGTSVASAEVVGVNGVVEAFFPSVYAIGTKGYSYLGNGDVNTKIDPMLNGNSVDNFSIVIDGQTIWGGQSAYMVRGNPINPSGFTRYENVDYMSYMYLLTLRGLMNGGLRVGRNNEVYMTVGMPPKIFYEQPSERRAIMDNFKYLLRPGENEYVKLCSQNGAESRFYVADLTFTAEGAGGYYHAILEDDLSEKPEASEYPVKGVLVVDVGRYTLDTFILVNDDLGEEAVFSNGKYGMDRLFEIIKDQTGITETSEIERYHYTGTSRLKQLRDDSYHTVYDNAMNMYLNELADILGHYHKYTNRFDPVLVMGGIVSFVDDNRLFNKTFSLGGHPVTYLDAYANARGYRKFAKAVKVG